MTIDHALAYWVTGPGRGVLLKEALPAPGPGEVLVRTLYSGISRGSEALVFRGEVPVSEYERMRAPFQSGDFPAPVKYGYINVGVVEQGPSPLVGRTVFCLYPHQNRYVVPSDAVHPLPETVPPGRAILAANLETAVNGLWDCAPRIGDRISVIGAGTLGCLTAWLAGRIPGCSVELVDINPDRAQVAAALGVAFATPQQAAADADRVIHTSGNAEGLRRALELGAFEASVTELSWYGSSLVTLPPRRGISRPALDNPLITGQRSCRGPAPALEHAAAHAAGVAAAWRGRVGYTYHRRKRVCRLARHHVAGG